MYQTPTENSGNFLYEAISKHIGFSSCKLLSQNDRQIKINDHSSHYHDRSNNNHFNFIIIIINHHCEATTIWNVSYQVPV